MNNPLFVPSLPPAEALSVAHVGESDSSERLAGEVVNVDKQVSTRTAPARLPVFGLLGECATSGKACPCVYRLPAAWVARSGEWSLACGARVQVSTTHSGQASAEILGCSGRSRQACAICPYAQSLRFGVIA